MKEADAEQVLNEIRKMDRQVLITMGLTFAIVFPSIFIALRYRIPIVELELLILVLAAGSHRSWNNGGSGFDVLRSKDETRSG